MLEVKALSITNRSAFVASSENIMAQHVKLFNALSPSDKQCWDTIAADLLCKHARNIEQEVQHNVDAINLVMSRAQAERADSGLMQNVSMIRLEYND